MKTWLKKKVSIQRWLVILFIVVGVANLASLLPLGCESVTKPWETTVKEYDARDKKAAAEYNANEAVMFQHIDSFLTSKAQFEHEGSKIIYIQNQANETRNNISALPTDQQLQFFAGWLSQIDTAER